MRRTLLVLVVAVVVLPLAAWLAAQRALGSDLARTTLERQLAARLGRPVHVGSASATIFPRIAVDLHDVTIGAAPPVTIARVQVVTGIRSLFTRTIADTSIESLAFRDIRLGAGDEVLHVDLDSSVAGDTLKVTRLTARARVTRISATGTLTSLSRMEGAFDVRADPLDLAEMTAIASAIATPGERAGAATPMHLALTMTAPHVQFGDYRFRDLTARVDSVPGHVTLDDLAFEIFGGTFRGRLAADTAGSAPTLRLNGRVAGLDMTDILKGSGSPAGITGRLGGSVALHGAGADAASLLRTARGTIALVIANGTLPRLDLVRRIVLAFGRPSGVPTEGSGTAFKTLGGTFVLAGPALTSDSLSMAARDFDMHGRGSLHLDSGLVDARADVVLSPELTAQAGTDLRRYAQEDGRVIVPAIVGGTLDAPSISVDVAAATRRAVGNELKRRATDFFGGLFKKKGGGE